ncbi:cardiolipin synthase ClsB [Hydrogenophaga sp. OTU3427]|uniref:cardiolipin synthase ClsB n=1 Tax=Hydrogenophaga sp. OTU3427 TaxID=3043856 RepID=UPI00313D8DFB
MAVLPNDDWRPARPQPGHRLQLLQGGEAFFPALVAAMDAAAQSVHLETYIFDFAGSSLQVAEALVRAARRGVHVRLVVDGIGTPHIPEAWRQRFSEAGVYWRVYAPLGRFGMALPSSWRRLHRKLCVVDGRVGFCGGINIIDDLNDVALGRLSLPRLDFSLQVSGPLVADMAETMERLWWRLQAVRKARQREFRAAWDALRTGTPVGDFSALFDLGDTPRPGPSRGMAHAGSAALVLRDNLRHRHDIERAYLKAIGEAHHEVLIANAYFIPGRKLRRALVMAVSRGVRVRLLLQGKYEHFMQYHAARPVFHQLLSAGVQIFEYVPSALHAKVAVVDRRWATVGSTNLDPLSLLLAREANVVSADEGFARALHERLHHIVTHDGRALQPQALAARPWPQRALDRLAFMVMRASLFLTGHRY